MLSLIIVAAQQRENELSLKIITIRVLSSANTQPVKGGGLGHLSWGSVLPSDPAHR